MSERKFKPGQPVIYRKVEYPGVHKRYPATVADYTRSGKRVRIIMQDVLERWVQESSLEQIQ